jgi:hypothetical protein
MPALQMPTSCCSCCPPKWRIRTFSSQFTSPTNPAGVIVDANGSKSYSAADLLSPALQTEVFYSALCSFGDGAVLIDLSFGADTSLRVTIGWDNVTGFGTPNGIHRGRGRTRKESPGVIQTAHLRREGGPALKLSARRWLATSADSDLEVPFAVIAWTAIRPG